MAKNNGHQKFHIKFRNTTPPPYLGNIPKKHFLVLPYGGIKKVSVCPYNTAELQKKKNKNYLRLIAAVPPLPAN